MLNLDVKTDIFDVKTDVFDADFDSMHLGRRFRAIRTSFFDVNDVSDVVFDVSDDSDSFEGLKDGSYKLGRCLWIRRTVSG